MQLLGSTDLENCPVSDDLLKRLLDSTVNSVAEIGGQLSESQRAELAAFCYRRSHFRDLGLALAALCSRNALITEAGHAGEIIYQQVMLEKSGNLNKDIRQKGGKAPISLHVV